MPLERERTPRKMLYAGDHTRRMCLRKVNLINEVVFTATKLERMRTEKVTPDFVIRK